MRAPEETQTPAEGLPRCRHAQRHLKSRFKPTRSWVSMGGEHAIVDSNQGPPRKTVESLSSLGLTTAFGLMQMTETGIFKGGTRAGSTWAATIRPMRLHVTKGFTGRRSTWKRKD
jgi:hypothetical protein